LDTTKLLLDLVVYTQVSHRDD